MMIALHTRIIAVVAFWGAVVMLSVGLGWGGYGAALDQIDSAGGQTLRWHRTA